MTPIPTQGLTDSRRAAIGAGIIYDAFRRYRRRFDSLTLEAKGRFERRDWSGMRRDAERRLQLYPEVVSEATADLCELLAGRLEEKLLWASMKAVYSASIAEARDWELAETFFNSISRRIFTTVGVDEQVEFVDPDYQQMPQGSNSALLRSHLQKGSLLDLLREVVAGFYFAADYDRLERDLRLASERLASELESHDMSEPLRIEMVKSVFYRGKGAYLIGRILSRQRALPLVLALTHPPEGIRIDALLSDRDDVSILFSFAHAYFHVEVSRPYDLVKFIQSLLPHKRAAELYLALGFHKHGKTELYRDLLAHLRTSAGPFESAPGTAGMVMLVFGKSDYDFVFKVIKDTFEPPKDTSRRKIKEKYQLVFKHDRAGRLIDAQEFEHLEIERRHFSEALLECLLSQAEKTVHLRGDKVIFEHVYLERRVTPLNLYIRERDERQARSALIDYGRAVADLAKSNIFPGDLLLKNFGVTRLGRVVFYDYDELCLLEECNFRRIPQARTPEQEMAAEPWYYVADNDIFPEEFLPFLGIPKRWRELFCRSGGALLGAQFWQEVQTQLAAGEVLSIRPYAEELRLARRREPVLG